MSGVNKAIIVGRVGKDPEIKYTAGGTAIANLSLATSESWKDKNTGEKQEKTEWHRCNAYGKLAEIIGQYVNKGSLLYIEGKIETRKWQDQSGLDRYSTEINVNQMQMLGGKSDNQQAPAPQQNQQASQQAAPAADSFDDELIPF